MSRAEELRRHPFVFVDDSRVRDRAYFLHLRRVADGAAGSAEDDWLQAEAEELDEWLRACTVRPDSPASVLIEDAYSIVANYSVKVGRHGEAAQSIRRIEPRRCALCGRGRPEVAFKQRAHLLPEAFGNRTLLTSEECDDCNGWAGRDLESHLATMFLADRVLGQVPTKSAPAAKIKLGDSRGFVGGGAAPGPILIETKEDDPSVKFVSPEPNRATLSPPAVKFKPISALRAIGRMAYLSIPPELRENLAPLREWIRGERVVTPMSYYRFFYPGTPLPFVGITCWMRTAPDPHLAQTVVMFYASHSLLVWTSPNWETGQEAPAPLPPLVRPLAPVSAPKAWKVVARSDEPVVDRFDYDLVFDYAFLHSLSSPLPVTLTVRLGTRTISIAGELSTPSKESPENLIVYEIVSPQLPGRLRIEGRNRASEWTCDLDLFSHSGSEELIAVLTGGASIIIDDERGRRIFPPGFGAWHPPY